MLVINLPLILLPAQELLENVDPLLQRSQPLAQLLVHPRLIIAQLGVEVLPVWGGRHGGGEDRLDEHAVELLKGVAVGVAEGDGEFFVWVRQVLAECLGREVESSVKQSY